MAHSVPSLSRFSRFQIMLGLFKNEWATGIYGLRLTILCVALASFLMGTVWVLGGGLSHLLSTSGTTFLGGDLAISSTNVAMKPQTRSQLDALGRVSEIQELRASAATEDQRLAIELKAVDAAYPLYGSVELQSQRRLDEIWSHRTPHPPALVEATFLTRTGLSVGDTFTIGTSVFEIKDILRLEPDRLSAGRFMVGPRVMITLSDLKAAALVQPGSISDYRYRIRSDNFDSDDLRERAEQLDPEAGYEIESPRDAGDRVLRTVERTTTFLGVAGIVAFTIGLSGAWAAANAWVQRRTRTIALYRLSGASSQMVLGLHGFILLVASLIGLVIGLGLAMMLSFYMLDFITARLHVDWVVTDLIPQAVQITLILCVGLSGTALMALSGVANVSPGGAMRSGETPLVTDPTHLKIAVGLMSMALIASALSLPQQSLALMIIAGFITAIGLLALAAFFLSRRIATLKPVRFTPHVLCQSLSNAKQTAARTVAIGTGIIGITAIVAAQGSLNSSLLSEIPDRVPDIVLIDIPPADVERLEQIIEEAPDLGGLQTDPFMRMTITAVNGVAAQDALVREDKSWVIEGDRSFSWTAEPTGAELLSGQWWPSDYKGAPLISPEEDVMEAFDLKVGDTMTFTFLGRSFTAEVANIRMEYHRTFRPEYLMVASPNPFSSAPHTWIMSFQGETAQAVDEFIRTMSRDYPNVIAIDIRPLVAQINGVITGATFASLSIALLLVIAGAASVAALVAADVDTRRKEALVFNLVGASRGEIAQIRLLEAGISGLIAAAIGGTIGLVGGYVIVTMGLNIDWSPALYVYVLPFLLGLAGSLSAGIMGGLGAAPQGNGQMVRLLTT